MPQPTATRGISLPIDRQRWDERIREHDRKVMLSLLALGLRPDRAREVAQMTWTRLIEKDSLGELKDITLPGLAIRQARFMALDSLRRDSADRRRLEKVAHLQSDAAEDGLEQQVLCRQQIDLAFAALSDCPVAAQQVFRILYTPPPRSAVDAADELGLSVQRVRQIVCETRKKLRQALEETDR